MSEMGASAPVNLALFHRKVEIQYKEKQMRAILLEAWTFYNKNVSATQTSSLGEIG